MKTFINRPLPNNRRPLFRFHATRATSVHFSRLHNTHISSVLIMHIHAHNIHITSYPLLCNLLPSLGEAHVPFHLSSSALVASSGVQIYVIYLPDSLPVGHFRSGRVLVTTNSCSKMPCTHHLPVHSTASASIGLLPRDGVVGSKGMWT